MTKFIYLFCCNQPPVEELPKCIVGPDDSGLMLPTGAQQFLQCELW